MGREPSLPAQTFSLCGPQDTAWFGPAGYNLLINVDSAGPLGDSTMRLFIACAIIVSATIGLGGCFGHHEKAVVVEPLKLG
jgi:hypothetical protein